jgi:polar amino acid transport system substrate-binding protein
MAAAYAPLAAGLLVFAALLWPSTSTAQTFTRIQSTQSINIGFVPDQAPFSFTAEDKEAAGYAVEVCRNVTAALKARLGFPPLRINFVATSTTAGLEMVEQGRLDLLCGAIPETLQARERVSFSIPIYISGVGALVRKDAPASLLRVLNGEVPHTGPTWRATVNAGLANHTYAVRAGTTSESAVRDRIAKLGVIARVVAVPTYEEGLKLVAAGKASAFFADRVVLTTYVASHGGDGLNVLDRRFTLEPVALALQRGDENFRLAVDTALSNLYRSGMYQRIYTRYFGEPSATAQLLFQAYSLP